MGLAWDLVRVAPVVAVGVYLLATARLVHREAPPTPALSALVVLLALRGVLNVIAPLWFVPGASAVAERLWPALDVLVAGAAFIWFTALPHRAGRAASSPGWRLATLVLSLAGAALLLVWPAGYWGGAATDGPLLWLNGLKFIVYGAIALSFFSAYQNRWGIEWRRSGLWLSAAFGMGVMHWVATDFVWVHVVGASLADVRTSPDHYARLVALLPMLWLMWVAGATMRRHERRGIRRGAGVLLAALLVPVMGSILVLDAYVFGAMSAAAANDWVVLWLDALWTLPVPFAIWMIVRHVPDGVDRWLAAREPDASGTPAASQPAQ